MWNKVLKILKSNYNCRGVKGDISFSRAKNVENLIYGPFQVGYQRHIGTSCISLLHNLYLHSYINLDY